MKEYPMGTPQKERTRKYRERRYAEIAEMEKIPCACGCGTLIAPFNKKLKPATFAHGHLPEGVAHRIKPGDPSYWKGKVSPNLVAAHRGSKHTPEHTAKVKASRMANTGGKWQVKRGWKQTDAARANMSAAQKLRDTSGEKNPFYGKTHTPETRAILAARPPAFKGKTHTPESRKRIADSITGALHWNWKGGKASLPYGPEFTRKFKHLIRQRDNYTCRRCGKTQAQEGRVLQVHHLDHNKQNNDPSNLATSCASCNVWASYHRDEPFTP
jgi:hypothetical protein